MAALTKQVIPVLELGDLLLVVRPQPVVRAHRLGELLQPRLQARHLETNIAFVDHFHEISSRFMASNVVVIGGMFSNLFDEV